MLGVCGDSTQREVAIVCECVLLLMELFPFSKICAKICAGGVYVVRGDCAGTHIRFDFLPIDILVTIFDHLA